MGCADRSQVYTAPHAPAASEAAPAVAASSETQKSADAAPAPAVPSSSAPDAAPAPTTETSTAPSGLVAAAVPTAGKPAAAGGSEPVLGDTHHVDTKKTDAATAFALAAPISTGSTATAKSAAVAPTAVPAASGGEPAAAGGSEPVLGNTHHITAPNTDPSTATPGHTAPVLNKPAPEAIETVAANANIGQEATGEEKTLLERAQELGAGAAVTIGAALGTAAHAIEDATGLDLTHGSPVRSTSFSTLGIGDTDILDHRRRGPSQGTRYRPDGKEGCTDRYCLSCWSGSSPGCGHCPGGEDAGTQGG